MAPVDRLTFDRLLCSVCHRVFTDPVSTPCGHNFCKLCVARPSVDEVPFQCPSCETMFFPPPDLQVNALLAELLEVNREPAGPQSRVSGWKLLLLCVFGTMLCNVLKQMEREEDLRQEVLEEIPEWAELKRIQRHAVDVTLDADTAYRGLIMVDDGKRVRCCDFRSRHGNPNRFAFISGVLGKQRFSTGKFYFEVRVAGKSEWTVGVAEEWVRRSRVTVCPQEGFWTISRTKQGEYKALSGPPVPLNRFAPPEVVGVFVDYEQGVVSFYNVDDEDLMFSFTACRFTHRLLPFLDPGLNDDGENGDPLILGPVSDEKM